MASEEKLRSLGVLVRQRFPAADGIRYGHSNTPFSDSILWQVLAGHEVIWDAGPAVTKQIPAWGQLEAAVGLMVQAIPLEVEGDWLILRLP